MNPFWDQPPVLLTAERHAPPCVPTFYAAPVNLFSEILQVRNGCVNEQKVEPAGQRHLQRLGPVRVFKHGLG